MKLSVVIPAYNEENYIDSCLNSLLKQTVKPDEIIVVNNNCTDNTVKIAKKYQAIIVKETKQGMIFARDTGFNSAIGDIIARCDADAILPPDWVKKIKTNFSKYKIDALTGPSIYHDLPLPNPIYADIYLKIMKTLHNGKNILYGPNMAITKKIWLKIRKNVCQDENKVHEDIDLAIHILKTKGKIRKDSSMIVSVSGRRIKNRPASFFIEYPIRLVKTFLNH